MSLILNVKSILMNTEYMIMHHMYQERVLLSKSCLTIQLLGGKCTCVTFLEERQTSQKKSSKTF